MTTIYLPVELSRREIVSRAFLATYLAKQGHDVFVFASDFFDRGAWPGPGIYIGKNVFREYVPHNLRFYEAMKTAGIRIWHHDEEGGLYFGDSPEQWQIELGQRVDVTQLRSDDKVLTWGEYQADYFRSRGTAAEVQVIGSVNFELFKPEYASYFSAYDDRETGGLKDYILVNTRFGVVNGFNPYDEHILDILHLYFNRQTNFNLYAEEGVVLYSMLQVIIDLCFQRPDELICIRPHPSEDASFYERLFRTMPNVRIADKGDVGSWIRRCRCLFQNGCTTAIQANIAEKPVITLIPPGVTGAATTPVPNEVGTIVNSSEEAVSAILNPPAEQEVGRWPIAISRLDTIERIAALVAEEKLDAHPVDERRLARSTRQAKRDALRPLAYPVFPAKRAAARQRERYFDSSLFAKFGEFVGIAEQKWDTRVSVTNHAGRCWRVKAQA